MLVAAPTPKAAMAESATTASDSAAPTRRAEMWRLGGLALAFFAILGYDAAGRRFYRGYALPQGYGMDHLLPEELAQIALFVAFGSLAMIGLVVALARSAPAAAAVGLFRRAARRVNALAAATAVWLFMASWVVSRFVLGHAAISDDEHVYRFIAQTLRTGSLTAPSPGADLPFFQEQFVVLTESVRYGKYPLGHPLLLALGQAVGAETLVVPLLTALLAVALFHLGRTLFGAKITALALLLLAVSPQVVLTGGRLLPQPGSAACLAFGFAALFRGVNRLQAGAALTTGYQAFHGTGEGAPGILRAVGGDLASTSLSVVGSILRLNVWLLGWPFSLAFCLFPFRDGRVRVLWGMVAAEGAYRVASPKVGIGGVGPLYLFELVPILLLLSSAGLAWVARGGLKLPWPALGASGLAAVVLAGVVTSA